MTASDLAKPSRRWRGQTTTDRLVTSQLQLDGVDVFGSAGRHHYVNPDSGSDGYGVSTRAKPYATMGHAFTKLRSGDTIHFVGKIKEQLTTPVQVFDVTIIGEGNRPRHADAEPAAVGGIAANTWTTPSSPTAATPLLTIRQQGWRLVNVLFAGPTDAACVQLFRDGGADDAERDASHTEFINCRFASGRDGIEGSGGPGHVGIYGCYFTDLTAVALKNTTGAGIGVPFFRWDIVGNRFQDCPSLMTAAAVQYMRFMDNTVMFASAPTMVFNLTGGKENVITGNVFNIAASAFDPTGHVTASTTDVFSNTLLDAIETGLPAD